MSDIDSNLPVRDTSDGTVGAAVPTIANFIGGTDGTNLKGVKVDTNGKVLVDLNDGSGTAITSTLISAKQGLDVNVVNSFASGVADKTTFTYGTTVENSIGGVFQDTSPTLTAGQQGAVRLTANRAFHTNLRDSSGNELLGQKTMAGSTPVAIASDQTAIPASQSGTWNINNVTGTVSLPTGASTSANQTNGTQQTQIVQGGNTAIVTASNALKVDGSAVTQPISGTVTANQGTNPWTVQGDSASGATKAGNPVQIGGVFNTIQPSVSSGQSVEAQSTSRGALIVATAVDPFSITNITGTVSLPTGAATAANQTTEITSLQIIDNPVGSVAAGTAGTNSYLTGGVFNTALPTLTTGQQVATQLDSSGRLIISPLASTSTVTANQGTANTHANAWFTRLTDGTDDSQVTTTGDLQVADIINTAGQFRAQSVTTSAAEALGAATILANRKMLSVTPTNGTVYWGFANTVTTSTGSPIMKNQSVTFAVGTSVHIYLIASGTVDCRIAEGS